MSKDRIKLTPNERFMANQVNLSENAKMFHMGNEKDIDSFIEQEKASKLNDEIDEFEEKMNNQKAEFDKTQEELGYDIEQAEIKPVFSRILIKPFKINPFQKVKIEKGVIIDAGGYKPHIDKNQQTGKYEEQEQFIKVGEVVEAGPDCVWVSEGDVVFYRKDTVLPVPFLDWGLETLNENQILAIVNLNLSKRFADIKNSK